MCSLYVSPLTHINLDDCDTKQKPLNQKVKFLKLWAKIIPLMHWQKELFMLARLAFFRSFFSKNLHFFTHQSQSYRDVGLVFLGVASLIVAVHLSIPLKPVPLILYDLVVLMIGLTYTLKQTFYTLGTFLGLGAMGLPVFAAGAGLAYLMGPTGGYLIGFLAAALIMSVIRTHFQVKSLWALMLLTFLGQAMWLSLGSLWLASFTGISQAFVIGVKPFLGLALVKGILAASITRTQHFRAKKR